MELNIVHQNKTVEIWLTRADQNDSQVLAALQKIYQDCKAKNYTAAVFSSGCANLYEQTRDLLLYNQQQLAKQTVKAQI